MSVSLDVMHSKPGIYVVMSASYIVFVETEKDGKCYQLKTDTFERDGELSAGGWNARGILGCYGPLYRGEK